MKKNNITLYAKALVDILSKTKVKTTDEDRITTNFVKLLIDSGYQNQSEKILELAQDLLLQKQGLRKITFETARKITSSQRKIMEDIVKKGDIIKEKINPALIAGIKITVDGQQYDNSLLAKLNKI